MDIMETAKSIADVGLLYIIAAIGLYLVITEIKAKPKREEERNKYISEHTKSNYNLTLSHQALIKTLEVLQVSFSTQGNSFIRHDERSIEAANRMDCHAAEIKMMLTSIHNQRGE